MSIRQMLRGLARMPAFTAVAVASLGIGIGANTAIFSVIEGVLLKPLPYPRSGELVALAHTAPGINIDRVSSAPFLYFIYREEGHAFQDVGLWNTGTASVTGLAQPEEVPTLIATDGILPMLGVQAMLGRLFSKTDGEPGGPETAVLTAGYWRSKFGSDPSAVGRMLTVDGRPREIIGVLPDTFRFLDRRVAIVLPYRFDRSKVFLGNFSYQGIARLKPGMTVEQANVDAARLIPIALTRFPPFPGGSVKMFEEARLTPRFRTLKESVIGNVQTVLWVLMGTVGIVLLIAGANVANLLLVRADSRQQELAIRAALGAGSGGIARVVLLESVALGVVGGILGIGLAFAALRLLLALDPGTLPRLEEIGIDVPVLLFTLVVSVGAGLLFGAVPAFRFARTQAATMLRGGGRTASASKERRRVRNALVVVQVALALVLLVGSGLMIRTFAALSDVHPGFTRPEDVLALRIFIPESQVKSEEAVARMHQSIMERLAAVPGVQSVALTSTLTMTGDGWHDPVFAQDRTYAESEVPAIRMFKLVAPGFMKTMGGSILAGRDFTWTDLYEARPVAMVSESLARDLWGEPAAAIGKRIRPLPTGDWREVVGVVTDMREDGLTEKPTAAAYWPLLTPDFTPTADEPLYVQRGVTYVIRSSRTGSSSFVTDVQQAIWSINPNVPLADIRTLQDIYDASLARTSFTLVMLAIAGGMALLLGVTGIYGVISYAVSQRKREIGIRVALGAQARTIRRMFVGQGVVLAVIGVTIGLAVAAGIMRVMSSLLFEVAAVDPLTYGLVSLALVGVTVLASYVPALRATAIDPVEALRIE